MDKLIRLSPTGIEYGDYAWNFASGCGNNTEGRCNAGGFNCWAYSISQRFEGHYPNGFNPTIYPEALLSPLYLKKPSRILCAFMGDLFWDCPEFDPDRRMGDLFGDRTYDHYYPPGWSIKDCIFETIRQCPQHTFLFLTKQAQNLPAWSPFPDNCWVGQTLTNQDDADRTFNDFAKVEALCKYVSLEPLLGKVDISPYLKGWVNAGTIFENPEGVERYDVDGALVNHIDLVIIGAQTKPTIMPKIEHVQEIVQACDKTGVKVFLKENLYFHILLHASSSDEYISTDRTYWWGKWLDGDKLQLRQEFPDA